MSLPIPLPFPRINGHELSRTSVDLQVDAIPVVGWTAIDFDSIRAPGTSTGSRSKPQARTRGKVTYPASLTVYETVWNVIRQYLATKGAPLRLGWAEVSTLITLTYYEPSLGPGSQVVELVGAQFLNAKQSISDADDQLTRVCTLSVMDVLENGISSVLEKSPTGF